MLRHADLGIHAISAEETPSSNHFSQNISITATIGKSYPHTVTRLPTICTSHRMADSERFEQFIMEEESNGTQRFFALVGPFLDALDKGGVLVIDELDCSMHPLLTHKLIEFFQSPAVNKRVLN